MSDKKEYEYEIVFRNHAVQRMFERSITSHQVRKIINDGETIETYPEDEPYPSRLLLGWVQDRPLHVVVADQPKSGTLIVITVYEPDEELWEDDFRRRRET